MGKLCDRVRTESNMFAAWRHVKRSALNSANGEIRGAAAEFEHQHQRHIRRSIDQLRTGKFQFDEVLGVLADQKSREKVGCAFRRKAATDSNPKRPLIPI